MVCPPVPDGARLNGRVRTRVLFEGGSLRVKGISCPSTFSCNRFPKGGMISQLYCALASRFLIHRSESGACYGHRVLPVLESSSHSVLAPPRVFGDVWIPARFTVTTRGLWGRKVGFYTRQNRATEKLAAGRRCRFVVLAGPHHARSGRTYR